MVFHLDRSLSIIRCCRVLSPRLGSCHYCDIMAGPRIDFRTVKQIFHMANLAKLTNVLLNKFMNIFCMCASVGLWKEEGVGNRGGLSII